MVMENNQPTAPDAAPTNSDENIFRGLGVEVALKTDDDFLKVKETLTRIGVASKKDKTLYQSCHILHKRGKFAIVHFKELFILDGKPSDITENDIARRNTITNLLKQWELVSIVDSSSSNVLPVAPLNQIKVVKYGEKSQWNLVAKYSIGKKKIIPTSE